MERAGLIPRLVARVVGWATTVFFEVERRGSPLPSGPVLVVANHPNSLLDPLMIFRTGERPARPLAKAPLFKQMLVGPALRALGGLPVYRRQDHPDKMHLNDSTFDAAIAALHAGDAVQIFPEGITHSEPSLAPVRTGAARIALLAESRADWKLGLRIVPVGLSYTRKALFRGCALAVYGEPFGVADQRTAYEKDEQEAVRALTAEVQASIERVTLNFDHALDRDLVDTAERLYASAKGWTTPRERASLGGRFPRLQAFADALRWLQTTDPDWFADLRARVARYRRKVVALGAGGAEVPERYRPADVTRYMVREVLPLVVGLPLAAVGTLLWLPVYLASRRLTRLVDPPFEAISTYKLSFGMVTAPLLLAAWVFLAYRVGGLSLALISAAALPVLGLWAIAWADRWTRIREDLRLYRRTLGRRDRQTAVSELRGELVEEFDRVMDAMSAAAEPRPAQEAGPS